MHEALHQLVGLLGGVGGEAGLVVDETRDVVALAAAEGGHFRHHLALLEAVGQALVVREADRGPVDDVQVLGVRDLDALAQVADDLIHQQDDRRAVLLREVEAPDGEVVGFADGAGTEGDDRVVAVGAPAGHHDVTLGRGRGHTRGRAGALDVHDDERNFRQAGVAEVLLLEGEARAAGGGHGLDACGGSADNGCHAGDLILHLKEAAPYLGQTSGGKLRYLSGRRNGIAGIKPHSCCNGTFYAGLVALHQNCFAHYFPSSSVSR